MAQGHRQHRARTAAAAALATFGRCSPPLEPPPSRAIATFRFASPRATPSTPSLSDSAAGTHSAPCAGRPGPRPPLVDLPPSFLVAVRRRLPPRWSNPFTPSHSHPSHHRRHPPVAIGTAPPPCHGRRAGLSRPCALAACRLSAIRSIPGGSGPSIRLPVWLPRGRHVCAT
uniref:Uncharacterized protein n=1 Tax=Oryza sativa subsp. japonica TaxID=39947 RepID=Q6I549_ORYSJ|nr:hypothetical protein [Oryza sativa Japonica Group]